MFNLSSSLPIFLFFTLAAGPCIDINMASRQGLEEIKHIGQSRAEQIIKLRNAKPFSSLDELSRVEGLGPSRISDIKKQGLACATYKEERLAAAVNESATEGTKQDGRWFYYFFAALALAISSGFVILLLKKHVRT